MLIRASELLPALAAIAITVTPCISTQASPAPAPPGIRIVYDDLNLATAAGVEALYGRVRVAAEQLCEPTRAVTGTRLSNGYERCVKDAVATTVQKINLPNLTALHAAQAGRGASSG